MKICAISFKECWRDGNAGWMSYGGFPKQMAAIGSLFDEMDLLIVESRPRSGGLPLPRFARIAGLREPLGTDGRRKVYVLRHMAYYLRAMYRHARTADVIHTPVPGDLAFLGMLLALVMRKRLIARYGGSWSANAQTTLMNRVTRAVMRLTAGGRNVMLAAGEGEGQPSQGVEWLFSTALSEDEVLAIRPDLDRGLAHPPRLTYAGRLSPEKGVASLIEAIGLLKREDIPMPRVTLLGDGPQRRELQELARKLKCSEVIEFRGQVDRAELSREFLSTDICVQPSLTESFGKAWIDAMIHGLPVVTCYIGSAEAAIGGQGVRGWLTPPADPPALAAVLRRVLVEPVDWPQLRRRCRSYAESFTLENWKNRIGEICAKSWNCRFSEGKLRE